MTDRACLLLIDLSSIYWAAWHASANEELSAAQQATVQRVHRLADGYDFVAVCCDSPPYKRTEWLPAYKAHRAAAPENAREQFRKTKERLEKDGFVLWHADGYEADDIIATATQMGLDAELDVDIASGDKDLLQLVSERVRVIKVQTNEVYDVERTTTAWGIPPSKLGDALALIGDKSDNIPGVPGVGPKRAAALLATYGTLGGVLGAARNGAEDITPKLREALVEHASDALLARRVVELMRDAPIEFDDVLREREQRPLSDTSEGYQEESTGDTIEAEFEETSAPVNEQPQQQEKLAEPAPQEPEQSTALVKHEGGWNLALEPTSSGSAWKLSNILYNSRLYSQFSSPEAILAVVLRGRALGLDATTSLANFHVVEGRPTMHADLIRGLVLRSGLCEYFDLVESTDEKCTWVAKRKGAKHEVRLTWTMEDALSAGLVTRHGDGYRGISKSGRPSNWDKYRRQMLRHRCSVETCRAVWPDVTSGLYTQEELEGS